MSGRRCRLAAAIELVVGEPWADLDGWEPAVGTAARYRELACQAEEQLVREELASGHYGAALAAASELVVREPLREQRWAALALAQYRAGRQGEALRTIGRARRVLIGGAGFAARTGAGRPGAGPSWPRTPPWRARRPWRVGMAGPAPIEDWPPIGSTTPSGFSAGIGRSPSAWASWTPPAWSPSWARRGRASPLWPGPGSLRRCAGTAGRWRW